MAPTRIIDSHVHLWPESMSNEDGHAWMKPGMPLARQHILSDYYEASEQNGEHDTNVIVEGIVYVETDVKYEKPSGDLSAWAKGPLDEIIFLRAIVEGNYGERDSRMLLGIVAWAPMDQPPAVLEEWLVLAEQTAGPQTWARVKGFRFLLQAITDKVEFEKLVLGADFVENLKILGRRGFSFDVGVDQNSGGVWQLEAISKAMKRAHEDVPEHENVAFILNHFCKPDFASTGEAFDLWRAATESMSTSSKTYMKLSGAFSELPAGLQNVADVASTMKPWYNHIFELFGPRRILFGSDWPVCNLSGPRKGASWVAWREVVDVFLNDPTLGISDHDRGSVWRDTALQAYRLAQN
ncbi:unnamed protein product [Zymoseptoria tritici ST99CH_1A5]|uniref:Amidohydrolase-related domain-containing protein n=2 Tax=Zymoseptoria tritici TaxID=1047171 RepID=A0A1X7RDZ6_ZYMT9|nr:unnamed protein product [Zymoseptoria tritici ST99CH_3D7]SMR43992.1 unnamed protein product [Zymoseptoria tritici ST99CH_3D1]SMY19149.1 unnamed protein product [Zymoseptoria tritici ST99CH_1A5]